MKAFSPILTTVFLMFFTLHLHAQGLRGTVTDERGESVPFATVSLHALPDSTMTGGASAGLEGDFTLPPPPAGDYYLQVSAVGYRSLTTPAFTVSGPDFTRQFDPIVLRENVEMLEEVVVEAMQAQTVAKADKLVMNVENTMLSSETSAYEVLKEAPGVHVDQNGELQLNGKSGVKVMIDGRDTYVTGEELKAMLESMPARNIEQVEVMGNPSARYEAEGTAGILNIKLKKNDQAGFNGSVYSDYTYNRLHQYSTGANLNFKRGAWSSFANLDFTRRGLIRDINLRREFHDRDEVAFLNQQGEDTRRHYAPSLRLGTDWAIGDRHRIGLTANLSYDDTEQDWNTFGALRDADPATDVNIDARNRIAGSSFDQTYNLHYTADLDTAGASLTANLDYVRLQNTAASSFFNTYQLLGAEETTQEKFTADNPTAYDILAARLDYVQPLAAWNGQLEAGGKVSHVVSRNRLDFFEEVDGASVPLEERFNHFTYLEDIYAGYVNLNTRLNDTWTLQAGLRAELTRSEGASKTLDQVTERSFLNLFPSLFVQQKVSDHYQLGYSYSRRINRPRYSRLNPYVFYIDPYTFIQGNPQLRPQYTHAFQVTQTFRRQYILTLGYDHSTDFIGEVPAIDAETRTTVVTIGNVEKFQNLSATLVAPVQIGSKVSIQNVLSAAYQNFETTIEGVDYENARLFFSARTSARVKLPADLLMELSANYRGPIAYGVYRIEGQWGVDAGFQRAFLDDKLSLNLRFQDIFRTQRIRGTVGLGMNQGTVDQYMSDQSVHLGLRYHFSRGERFESDNRKPNLEELQRAGG